MFHVITADVPAQSQLNDRLGSTDFIDCFSVKSDLSPRKAAEIVTDFPGWAQLLLKVRGILTAPFGLMSEGPAAADKVGIFPVEVENEHELIAGFNDKHLDFRVSVISSNGHVFLATWVHPHNLGGRLYLRAIMPFHKLIVRESLNRVRRESLQV